MKVKESILFVAVMLFVVNVYASQKYKIDFGCDSIYSETNQQSLTDQVNRDLEMGWETIGGVAVSKTYANMPTSCFSQALIYR